MKKIVLKLENGDYERTQSQYNFITKKPIVSPERKPAVAPSTSVDKPKISVDKVKVSSVGRE